MDNHEVVKVGGLGKRHSVVLPMVEFNFSFTLQQLKEVGCALSSIRFECGRK